MNPPITRYFKKAHRMKPEFALLRWCDYTNRPGLTSSIVKFEDCAPISDCVPTTTMVYFQEHKKWYEDLLEKG